MLGLARDATPEQVERAWRVAVRATHPDCHPDRDPRADDRRVLDVLQAGRILRDPARRAAWDRAHPVGPTPSDRRPTWTALAWDGGAPQRHTDNVPGRVHIVHRKD